jgi:hypothetical protein
LSVFLKDREMQINCAAACKASELAPFTILLLHGIDAIAVMGILILITMTRLVAAAVASKHASKLGEAAATSIMFLFSTLQVYESQ